MEKLDINKKKLLTITITITITRFIDLTSMINI